MKLLMEPDATQRAILPHLRTTEELIATAASETSKSDQHAKIVALPDLGLPHNVRRMHGGFFTGALYQWTGETPIVPVDATVNVCGVSVFRTSLDPSSLGEFLQRVESARQRLKEDSSLVWNWDLGNHFITLTEVAPGGELPEGRYLVLHASAAEFKKQYNGLYPQPGNWFYDDIRTVWHQSGRYLRYLCGRRAEEFHQVAQMLVEYQRTRQRICAELICGQEGVDDEVISVPHYGMPDQNSIAIGCQWMSASLPEYLLLTRPDAPLYLISAELGGENEISVGSDRRMLTPHGLGVRAVTDPTIRYGDDHLVVGGTRLALDATLAGSAQIAYRSFEGLRTVEESLKQCPGRVVATLNQIYSHYRKGRQS